MKLLVIIHILVCIVLYLLLRLGVLKATRNIFPIVCLVPVWGFVSLLLLEFDTRRGRKEGVQTGVEKLLIEDDTQKNILAEEDQEHRNVAPINEILAMNDSKTRRSVIMDVLYDDPEGYVEQLQEASVNDDTEVVHYAVTALIELQKEFEQKLLKLERKRKHEPDNQEYREEYFHLVEQYVESGLSEESSLKAYLRIYSGLLEEELQKKGESFSLYRKKARADLKQKEYDSAYQSIRKLIEGWLDRETGYLEQMEYYAALKDRDGIKKTIKEIRDGEVHLSPAGRAAVGFWQRDTEDDTGRKEA